MFSGNEANLYCVNFPFTMFSKILNSKEYRNSFYLEYNKNVLNEFHF